MTETAVYKAYDADGALLYVGVAKDFLFRWKSHRREAEWWKLAQRFEVALYATRDEALAEEARCITEDGPAYNACALAKGHAAKHRQREDAEAAEEARRDQFWRDWHAETDKIEALSKADPKARPIKSPETWRRWLRDGCPGVDD